MKRQLPSPGNRDPLKVLFAITVMPVGGAETLLASLVRRLDRSRFAPELCCLKTLETLGEEIAREIPTHHGLIARNCKYDVRVLPRLIRLMRRRRIDAVVTVGAGDTMFWARLAARLAGVPVVVSTLHSTGWPDEVGRLNRWLTPLTDAFVAVADEHGRFLARSEGFPENKVHVIPSGVDVERFVPSPRRRATMRQQLGLNREAPVCGILAALRPEKNHPLFLSAAALARRTCPDAQFLIIGDGSCRESLEAMARDLGLAQCVRFLGSRADVPDLLAALDVFSLTSLNEANPIAILEAMACGLPVVATRVGSVAESVNEGLNGYLVASGDAESLAGRWTQLFRDAGLARQMGAAGRQLAVDRWSVSGMVRGYQDLISDIYARKIISSRSGTGSWSALVSALMTKPTARPNR